MKRRMLVLGCLAFVVAFHVDCPAKPPANECVVELDAHTRTFVAVPSQIPQGSVLVLRVTNPNHFRETYGLSLRGVDLHGLAIPSALQALIATSQGQIRDLPNMAALVRPSASTLQALPPTSGALPLALVEPSRQISACLQQIRDEIAAVTEITGADVLVSRLAHELKYSTNNAAGRRLTIEYCARLAGALLPNNQLSRRFRAASSQTPTVPDTLAALQRALGGLVPSLNSRAARWQSDWKTVKENWDRARAETPPATETNSATTAIEAVTAQIESGDKWLKETTPAMDRARKNLGSFVSLAAIALDPVLCPDSLERRARTDGDEMVASVSIRAESQNPDSLETPDAPVTTFSVRIPVSNHWNLGISAGLIATGLVHRNYILVPSREETDTRPIVQEGSRDKADVQPALLLHYMRTGCGDATSWGLGPAFGLTVGDPIRYLAGLSLYIGRRLRFTLTAGVAEGHVDVLNGEYVGEHLVGSTLETKSVIRPSGFAGISLSLGLPPGN